MTYAVFVIATNTTAKDSEGNPHNYSTQEQAQRVCDLLNCNNPSRLPPDKFVVKPV